MSSSISFSFVIANFIFMRTENLYGINNKSNSVGVVRMYVTTCGTNKLQMNPDHLQQFLPNLHNWTSVTQLFQAQLTSSKRMEIGRHCDSRISYEKSITLNTVPAQNYSQYIYMRINTHFRFMGNRSRYIHTHYAIAFIVNSIHVFNHLRQKWEIKCTTRL